MKRSIKNVIAVLIIIIAGISTFFTMKYLSPNVNSSNSNVPEMMQNGNMGTPPEKPSDESDSSDSNMSEPPEKPSDDNSSSDSNMPQMPGNNDSSNQSEDNNLSVLFYTLIIIESLIIGFTITYLLMSKFNKKTRKETFENSDKVVISILTTLVLGAILSTTEICLSDKVSSNNDTNDIKMNQTEGSYSSSTADENAISASGDINVDISNITVGKTGDSDGGDNTSFYGTNSAILAKSGATLNLNNITVTTDATGANGVFSYGGSATTSNSSSDGTTVNISDSTITTTKDNSGGIMTTGGGVMNATNLTINTAGTSSAAIRSDRGGGDVTVNKGTYTTTGQGSPAIYSTANIKVSNATLISKASEGVVIEGKNSVTLDNVELTDSNTKLNGQSTTYKNIFLYQSMSGDADTGVAEFTSKNSKITTNNGDTLYVTNTTTTITLENNTIVNNDSSGNFLRVQKDSWGNSGSNGGDVTLVMKNQTAQGNIVVDSISTLDMQMSDSSIFEGAINTDNSAKSITLKLDKSSKIKLTYDSYVTSLENSDSSNSNIDFNGYKLYVNGKAIN